MSRLKVRAMLAVAAVAVSVIVVTGTASPAYACIIDNDGDCYRSVTGRVTATAGLNMRAAPWGTVLDTLPYNYSNIVDCYVQASDASYWDWIYDTRIGRSGWVYDPYLYTGGNIYQQVDEMNEGHCGQWPVTMPANITATALGTGSVRVTWTDTNGGGAKYVVSNGNVSSADLPAGTTSYTWTGLAPNTYMCFTVAAKANGGQSPWSPYACTTTLVYLNMGDSFSSGQGAGPPWQAGTNVSSGSQQNMCHRSPNSYSGLFANMSGTWRGVTNVACSGAVTADIYTTPSSTCGSPAFTPCNSMSTQTYGEQAQTNYITRYTGLITITIGGNDLDLADKFLNCYSKIDIITRNQCFLDTFSPSYVSQTVDHLAPTIQLALQKIKDRAATVGAHPTYVVLTYPQTYPNNWSGVCVGLPAPVTSPEMANAIRVVINHLNTQVRTAATNVGFLIVDEETAFQGHEECSQDSWVNDLGALGQDPNALHPKASGYDAMAHRMLNLLG